jgi:hypothetical protein
MRIIKTGSHDDWQTSAVKLGYREFVEIEGNHLESFDRLIRHGARRAMRRERYGRSDVIRNAVAGG